MNFNFTISSWVIGTSLASLALTPNQAFSQQKNAESYPTRAVRWVVPFPPGASNDVVARLIAQKLSEAWHYQVVIDNRGGASGLIGADIVAKAAPDGQTLLLSNPSSNAMNFALRTKTPYKSGDFQHVILLGWSPIMLVTSNAFPANNLKELIALAKAKPAQLLAGSSGTGGSSHLALELFKYVTDTNIVHVPYKGAAAAITDIIGGRIALIFTTPVTAQPLITNGKLKTLGIAGNKRLALYPDVPTSVEQGVKGFDVLIWFGVSIPTGSPTLVGQRINRDLNQILDLPDVRERFSQLGLEPQGGTPERFASLIREDTERWVTVVKAANIHEE